MLCPDSEDIFRCHYCWRQGLSGLCGQIVLAREGAGIANRKRETTLGGKM